LTAFKKIGVVELLEANAKSIKEKGMAEAISRGNHVVK
jgi:hypothetical protein